MNTPFRTLAARGAFVLLAVLPTFAMLGYLGVVSLQSAEMSAEAWGLMLSERTGLEIQIGRMERTAAGEFLLERFEIGDPESGAIWISAPSVTATLNAQGLMMRTQGAALKANALGKLSQHLEERVLKGRRQGFLPITISATNCALVLVDASAPTLSIPELTFLTRIEADGPEVHIEAKVIEEGVEALVTLDAWRIRHSNDATTIHRWTVGGDAGLSATTLAEFSPQWLKLGPHARFRGAVEGGANGSEYVFKGIRIDEIDLATLGQEYGFSGLSGVASIGGHRVGESESGAQARLSGGEFSDLFAELHIQAGVCDPALFDGLRHAIGFEVAEGLPVNRPIKFDEFAVRVQLLGENLQFKALLDDSGKLMDRGGKELAWINANLKRRNARSVLEGVLADGSAGRLAASQWIAMMPETRPTTAKSTGTGSKMR